VKNKKVYLKAITLGQESVLKEMDISVIINCKVNLIESPKDLKNKNSVVALQNNIGAEYNVANVIMTGFKFEVNDDKICPIDTLYLFKSDRETLIVKEGFALSDFKSEMVPG